MTPRVVMVTGELPHDAPDHAGGVYVQHLHRLLAARTQLSVIAPDVPATRLAATRPGAPERLLMSRIEPGATVPRRVLNRADHLAQEAVRARLLGLPSHAIVRALLRDSPERAAVQAADVIDLQWSEAIRLAPLLRRLNPRARLVGTFHDVQSQAITRLSRQGDLPAARINIRQLERAERHAVRRLDATLVFSRKDRDLLGGSPDIRIVRPPLAPSGTRPRHLPGPGCVVGMVSAWSRPENQEAARWLLERVWPRVVQEVPAAALRLIGAGATPALIDLAAQAPAATLTGFVPDLAAEYAATHLALVPMLRGAGVKFKTIEAMVHGVPVAATSVGAEGIGGPEHYAVLTDDPDAFARGVVDVLRDLPAAQSHADAVQAWAGEVFGTEQFVTAIGSAYGGHGWRD